MKPRPLWRATLPPLPPLPSDEHRRIQQHLLWHPERRELWMLDLGAPAIWRIHPDGSGEQLFSGKQVGIPARLDLHYGSSRGFYFDTARRAPVWFIATFDELVLGVLDGPSFREIETREGITPADADVHVFDPRRGVLVHFAGTSDTMVSITEKRAARGGLTVRELGVDDVWREAGISSVKRTGSQTVGGWDDRLGLAVLVDSDGDQSHGWDGTRWHKLGRYPLWPWRPFVAGQAPRSGALVIVQKERAQGDGVQCVELGDGRWIKRDVRNLSAFGGMARDTDASETFLYGPKLGEGAVTHTLGRYEGKGFTPAGRLAPALTSGSTAGPVRFVDRTTDRHGHEKGPPQLFALASGALAAAGSLAPGIAHVVDRAGGFTVTSTGEVLVDGDQRSAAPRRFTPRDRTCLGSDGRGTLLLVGGQEASARRRLTDTWRFDGAWTQLATTGAAPTVVDALVAHDPARQVWLVVGGSASQRTQPSRTSELDGTRWTTFPSRYGDDAKISKGTDDLLLLLAVDEVSEQVLLVHSELRQSPRVLVYRGQGQWHAVATLEDLDQLSALALYMDHRLLGALAWDADRRVLVGASSEWAVEFDLGPVLDAARREEIPPRSVAKVKGTPRAAGAAKPASAKVAGAARGASVKTTGTGKGAAARPARTSRSTSPGKAGAAPRPASGRKAGTRGTTRSPGR